MATKIAFFFSTSYDPNNSGNGRKKSGPKEMNELWKVNIDYREY